MKKNYQIHVSIDKDFGNQLQHYCIDNDISLKQLVITALQNYFSAKEGAKASK